MPGHGVVLLSGGLDSTVCMALACAEHAEVLALSFDYGQRHRVELDAAAAIAEHFGAEPLIVSLDASAWGGSALTDASIDVPDAADSGGEHEIPVTYVPARNLIFLSLAMGIAEARRAKAIYIGVNALDYSGYPDCRPEFVEAMRVVAMIGQKRGLEGRPVQLRTPLVELTKAQIVRLGVDLGAPLELSWSCYRGGPRSCGDCDACLLRARGFAEAGVADRAAAALS